MNVVAFAASNSRTSINRMLVRYAGEALRGLNPAVEITYLDLNDFEMPIFSVEREVEGGIPGPAKDFFDLIGTADAVIISFAEHNGSYTVAYKNVFDWASRIRPEVYQGKPLIALSASPGPRGAAGVLDTFLAGAPFFGAKVMASLSVGSFGERFDPESVTPSDPKLYEEIRQTVASLGDSEKSPDL
ncbi:NAD(P)H-dependent oxidoreductase [Congregibacter variabilis]|uniref:NAD(P)H-dependent oxidoreductase n=1 Tax=Congregibacter variabilis TaxID=3081200 RepID=A0ABZ0I0C7_9GAMM|nr:NAD(P)H-dependent oxidoreductase [Congregibacter sp. IMCC43200]